MNLLLRLTVCLLPTFEAESSSYDKENTEAEVFDLYGSCSAQCMQTANMQCEQTAKTSCATSCAPPTPSLCSSLWQSTTISTYTQWIQTLTSLNLLKSDNLAMMSDCRSITP